MLEIIGLSVVRFFGDGDRPRKWVESLVSLFGIGSNKFDLCANWLLN
jgi:hypothetical protein